MKLELTEFAKQNLFSKNDLVMAKAPIYFI